MKVKPLFEPHLAIQEIKLPRGGGWTPQFRGWCFLQIKSGICYWQEPGGAREVPAGSVLVRTREARGGLCASQLSGVEIAYFTLEPEKLTGLLSLGEQRSIQRAAEKSSMRVLAPAEPIAERFKELCLKDSGPNLSARLKLLQLFVDLFAREFEELPAPGAEEKRRMAGEC
jgi:hypothetical protein